MEQSINYVSTVLPESTSTMNFDGFGERILVGVHHNEHTIEILYKREPMYTYTTSSLVYNSGISQPRPQAVKEIWGVKDGKLALLDTKIGHVNPAHYVEEELEFPD